MFTLLTTAKECGLVHETGVGQFYFIFAYVRHPKETQLRKTEYILTLSYVFLFLWPSLNFLEILSLGNVIYYASFCLVFDPLLLTFLYQM